MTDKEEERDFNKLWSEAPEMDRKAILATLRAHVRNSTERRQSYKTEHVDNEDPLILEAFDSRQNTAEIALQILGEAV